MSLVACPNCHQEISREAAACPHCGATPSHSRSSPAGTVLQLLLLALALAVTMPLAKQEYLAWKNRASDTAATASEPAPVAAVRKAKRRAKPASRSQFECGSADVERGVTLSWRDEVAQVLASQRGIPLEDARQSVARMKLDLSEFQTQDEDRTAGTLQCAAVVTVSEGDGFQASTSEITYRAELADRGRTVFVTLIYAPVPQL